VNETTHPACPRKEGRPSVGNFTSLPRCRLAPRFRVASSSLATNGGPTLFRGGQPTCSRYGRCSWGVRLFAPRSYAKTRDARSVGLPRLLAHHKKGLVFSKPSSDNWLRNERKKPNRSSLIFFPVSVQR